jgi:O-antigen ligase
VRRLLVLCAVVGLAGAVLVGTLGAGFLTVPLDRLAGSQMLSAAALDEPALDEGDYLRTVMYLEGIAAIRADPWRGLGYNALGSVVEAATGARLISHNILLTAWGELGATGLVLALMIAGVGTARVWRARANTRNVDPKAFYFHTATLIAWALALAHAQVRPQLTNPMFHVVVAAAFAAGSHHVTWSRDARPSR